MGTPSGSTTSAVSQMRLATLVFLCLLFYKTSTSQPSEPCRDTKFCVSRVSIRVMSNDWRRKILDKFGGTSTIDASIMVFGLPKFCASTKRI